MHTDWGVECALHGDLCKSILTGRSGTARLRPKGLITYSCECSSYRAHHLPTAWYNDLQRRDSITKCVHALGLDDYLDKELNGGECRVKDEDDVEYARCNQMQ